MKRTTITIDERTIERLKALAAYYETSVSQVIRILAKNGVETNGLETYKGESHDETTRE